MLKILKGEDCDEADETAFLYFPAEAAAAVRGTIHPAVDRDGAGFLRRCADPAVRQPDDQRGTDADELVVSARYQSHRNDGDVFRASVPDDPDGGGLSREEPFHHVPDVAAHQLYRPQQDPHGNADDHLLYAQALYLPPAAQHVRNHPEHQRRRERLVQRDLRDVRPRFRRADHNFADVLSLRGRFPDDGRYSHRAGNLLSGLFRDRAQEDPLLRPGKQKSHRENVQGDPAGDGRHQRSQDHGQREVLCRRLQTLRRGICRAQQALQYHQRDPRQTDRDPLHVRHSDDRCHQDREGRGLVGHRSESVRLRDRRDAPDAARQQHQRPYQYHHLQQAVAGSTV